MVFNRTEIEGVWIVEPKVFEDARGYFCETFSEREFKKGTGLDITFVQDNESCSSYGVVRGLHFQKGEHSQAKLVRVIEGKVLDVAVDMRRSSPTFGKHVAVKLTSENKRQLFIPRGFAHGFAVLSERAVFAYKCDNYYAPGTEGGILWNDPALGIEWRLDVDDVLLSDKDRLHPLLKDSDYLF